ncbi:MAG: endonuclease/exonuclease/phosphatase family protein [Prevotellaceae bacterium]|jgi:endonuclease/exonuclease/phosphatase family metal-dependent hydrolase|nr:endonuclease/exonuclease/phosphatase family protein [Prevotellaceae bacterium]
MKSTFSFFRCLLSPLSLLAALTILSLSCGHPKKELNIMTFNIRYDNPADAPNAWTNRREHVARTILRHNIDIVGFQEVLNGQLNDLKALLPEYDCFGVGRTDGAEAGEYCPVFYKRSRFKLEDSACFWLSETPDAPGSKGWDAACERIVTCTRLSDADANADADADADASRRQILFVNTHLDHVGAVARKESVALLLRKIGEMRKGAPVILVGDFNAPPDNEIISGFTRASDTLRLTHVLQSAALKTGAAWTFHAFGALPEEQRSLIDYIFADPQFETLSHNVLPASTDNGVFLSDHCAVSARLKY